MLSCFRLLCLVKDLQASMVSASPLWELHYYVFQSSAWSRYQLKEFLRKKLERCSCFYYLMIFFSQWHYINRYHPLMDLHRHSTKPFIEFISCPCFLCKNRCGMFSVSLKYLFFIWIINSFPLQCNQQLIIWQHVLQYCVSFLISLSAPNCTTVSIDVELISYSCCLPPELG